MRKTNPALRAGDYVPLESGNAKVLAYARRTSSGRGVLVLLNMSDERQTLNISGWQGAVPKADGVIMASVPVGQANLVNPVLEPFATALVSFRAP